MLWAITADFGALGHSRVPNWSANSDISA